MALPRGKIRKPKGIGAVLAQLEVDMAVIVATISARPRARRTRDARPRAKAA